MKPKHLLMLFSGILCTHFLFAQISNLTNQITLANGSGPSSLCPWYNPPSGNFYTVSVMYEDGDDYGNWKTVGPYAATVSSDGNGGFIIDAPSASFPTLATTAMPFDFSLTIGKVTLTNTSTSATYSQGWQYTQYECYALPLYLTSFTMNTNNTNYLQFDWQSQDEYDISYFRLQKSYNKVTWYDEVYEPPMNNNSTNNYSVKANRPGYPWVWYRLIWTDESTGKMYRSGTIQAFNTGNATNVICNYVNIEGPSGSVCIPANLTYKLHNKPANYTNTWNLSSSAGSVISTSNGGLIANVSIINGGNWTLNATSSNSSCTKTKTITALAPAMPTLYREYNSEDCYSMTVIASASGASCFDWYVTGDLVINGSATSISCASGYVTISSAGGIGGTVYARQKNGNCYSLYNSITFQPCIKWDNANFRWHYAAPLWNEPLQAEVDPLEGAVLYQWFVNGQLIETTYGTYLSTYNWPCTSEGSGLTVFAVTQDGRSVGIGGGTYSPICYGTRTMSNVDMYPNPASSQVQISIKNPEARMKAFKKSDPNAQTAGLKQITEIRIIDKTGQVRKVTRFGKGNTKVTINVSDLSSDTYFLEVSDGNNKVRMPLVVKR